MPSPPIPTFCTTSSSNNNNGNNGNNNNDNKNSNAASSNQPVRPSSIHVSGLMDLKTPASPAPPSLLGFRNNTNNKNNDTNNKNNGSSSINASFFQPPSAVAVVSLSRPRTPFDDIVSGAGENNNRLHHHKSRILATLENSYNSPNASGGGSSTAAQLRSASAASANTIKNNGHHGGANDNNNNNSTSDDNKSTGSAGSNSTTGSPFWNRVFPWSIAANIISSPKSPLIKPLSFMKSNNEFLEPGSNVMQLSSPSRKPPSIHNTARRTQSALALSSTASAKGNPKHGSLSDSENDTDGDNEYDGLKTPRSESNVSATTMTAAVEAVIYAPRPVHAVSIPADHINTTAAAPAAATARRAQSVLDWESTPRKESRDIWVVAARLNGQQRDKQQQQRTKDGVFWPGIVEAAAVTGRTAASAAEKADVVAAPATATTTAKEEQEGVTRGDSRHGRSLTGMSQSVEEFFSPRTSPTNSFCMPKVSTASTNNGDGKLMSTSAGGGGSDGRIVAETLLFDSYTDEDVEFVTPKAVPTVRRDTKLGIVCDGGDAIRRNSDENKNGGLQTTTTMKAAVVLDMEKDEDGIYMADVSTDLIGGELPDVFVKGDGGDGSGSSGGRDSLGSVDGGADGSVYDETASTVTPHGSLLSTYGGGDSHGEEGGFIGEAGKFRLGSPVAMGGRQASLRSTRSTGSVSNVSDVSPATTVVGGRYAPILGGGGRKEDGFPVYESPVNSAAYVHHHGGSAAGVAAAAMFVGSMGRQYSTPTGKSSGGMAVARYPGGNGGLVGGGGQHYQRSLSGTASADGFFKTTSYEEATFKAPENVPKYSERDVEIIRNEMTLKFEKEFELAQLEVQELEARRSEAVRETTKIRDTLNEWESFMKNMISKKELEDARNHTETKALRNALEKCRKDKEAVIKDHNELMTRYRQLRLDAEDEREVSLKLRKVNDEAAEQLKIADARYETLKVYAERKMESANTEIARVRAGLENEISALKIKISRSDLQIESLKKTLDTKEQENLELTKICDDLMVQVENMSSKLEREMGAAESQPVDPNQPSSGPRSMLGNRQSGERNAMLFTGFDSAPAREQRHIFSTLMAKAAAAATSPSPTSPTTPTTPTTPSAVNTHSATSDLLLGRAPTASQRLSETPSCVKVFIACGDDGDKYGKPTLPTSIPVPEFEAIVLAVATNYQNDEYDGDDNEEFLRMWFIKDTNQNPTAVYNLVPVEYHFPGIGATDDFAAFVDATAKWDAVRSRLLKLLKNGSSLALNSNSDVWKQLHTSVLEYE
ncbi:Transforming acidic coiled-coil-containing protein 3, partial [Physocladia obscura]